MRSPSDQAGVHNQVGWMTPSDVAILTFLSNCQDNQGNYAILSPAIISDNIGFSQNHIGIRCRTLADHDLVEKVDRGKYRLSGKGHSLLNGGIDPVDLARD